MKNLFECLKTGEPWPEKWCDITPNPDPIADVCEWLIAVGVGAIAGITLNTLFK